MGVVRERNHHLLQSATPILEALAGLPGVETPAADAGRRHVAVVPHPTLACAPLQSVWTPLEMRDCPPTLVRHRLWGFLTRSSGTILTKDTYTLRHDKHRTRGVGLWSYRQSRTCATGHCDASVSAMTPSKCSAARPCFLTSVPRRSFWKICIQIFAVRYRLSCFHAG
jgi:hypothetical protein